jgi:hypothetical protein
LKHILEIPDEWSTHSGLKRGKSTSTSSAELHSIIGRALNNECLLMASLDLICAFGVVIIGLLLKRLKIAGLPGDVINLIIACLK